MLVFRSVFVEAFVELVDVFVFVMLLGLHACCICFCEDVW